MSSNLFNRFAAFKELHGQRLGKDIMGIICRKIELQPVDFIDKIDDLQEEMVVYSQTADAHVEQLYATYEAECVNTTSQKRVLAASNEYNRVYDEYCTKIKRMKTEIGAVKVEFREFMQ